MKVALIVALGRLLQYYDRFHTIKGLVRPFAMTLLPMGLILIQPDLGTALCCLPVLFVMLFVAGARWRHLLLVVVLGLLVAPIIFSVGLKEYQRQRLTSFWNQESTEDVRDAGYQLAQSKLAIGSGGWFGKGYRRGTIPVPVQTTDFIFTVVAEEGGLLGGTALIGLQLLLCAYLVGIAARCRERFGMLIVAGTCALIAFQGVVNMAMTMGLAPITGLTLPLASYGGSSLLSTFILLGLALNVEMRRLRPFGATGPVTSVP
jgi:cell division protein FtsW (lipid II flippase)